MWWGLVGWGGVVWVGWGGVSGVPWGCAGGVGRVGVGWGGVGSGEEGCGGVQRVGLPYGKKRRIKPGSPAQSQTISASIETWIIPGSMAL